jgi:hypothetical protein
MTRLHATLERLRPFHTLPFRASDFAGTRASRLGERRGWDWLTYNPMTMLSYHRMARRDAGPVMAAVRQVFPDAAELVDVGAGSGAYAAAAARSGVRVVALERSRAGRAMAKFQRVPAAGFELRDVTLPQRRADLAYCFEVAEHLPPELGQRLVQYLAAAAPLVVFTAAHPGQGGYGHINEQPKSHWIERFQDAGMETSEAATAALQRAFRANGVEAPWFDENVLVFRAWP